MNCRPGDLAIVLRAYHADNVGAFVHVVGPYDGADAQRLGGARTLWLVESQTPLTWTRGASLWQGLSGPVPDEALQPIRGPSCCAAQPTGISVLARIDRPL